MNRDKKSKAKGFFELGIAFAMFTLVPDEAGYKIICEAASPLKLEVPDFDELLVERRDGVVIPPQEWFKGSEGESLKNYSQIGFLSVEISVSYMSKKKKINSDAVQVLRSLVRAESIPEEVLDDYLTDLMKGDTADAFRRFRPRFLKALDQKNTETKDANAEDRLKFNDLKSAPSCFEKDIVDAIEDTLRETSVCYENQCYRATIMLCGSVIETLIKNVYKPLTGKEIYTTKKGKKIERTFKNMCDDLRDRDTFFDKRTNDTLDLIYLYRSGAIHEAGWRPGKNKASGIAIFTSDFMNGLFEYLSDHSLVSEKADC